MATKKSSKKLAAKKKLGRKPILNAELVAAAIADLEGNISSVAKRFNVSRSAVQQLVQKNASLQQVLHDAREGLKDDAESQLHIAIRSGESWAVCFFLKTQAKDRGYVERQELDHTARTRLVIEEEIVDGDAGGTDNRAQENPAQPQAV